MTLDKGQKVRLYLCECGPIIRDAIDLDELQSRLAELPEVSEVVRHTTLCSHDGKQWMVDDLSKHPDQRPVVAGCSPKEHEGTFKEICRKSRVNPYLLAIANIREHCTWVTDAGPEALEKAQAITRAAVSRACLQTPLEEQFIDANPDVLIIGSGVAGLTAAQLMAGADRKVYLIERSPAAGGRTALLGDVFPGFECASCMLQPLVDDVLHHPQIDVMTSSEVEEVLGYFGNFTVRIARHPRHVDPEECYGCRTCHAVCPVEVPNEYDEGLSTRKAIHIPYEGALPNASVVDRKTCLKFNEQECDLCVASCPFGSINLEQQEETVEVNVGAIIVATGSEPEQVDPTDNCGRIVSAMALERMLNSSGPTGGEVVLPNGTTPRKIALVHCADESGFAPVDVCSKICCMSFAKYARQLREKLPDCEIHQLMWERCVGGKNFKTFADAAEQTGNLTIYRMAPKDRVDGVSGEDEGATINFCRDGKSEEIMVDMVVVAPPMAGAMGASDVATLLQLELGRNGYFLEEHERLRPFKTLLEGVLIAGAAQGPADIQDSSSRGAAAAGGALSMIVPGKQLAVEPATTRVDLDRCGSCGACVLTCPYKAVSIDKELDGAKVNELLCRGCGSCAAACPAGAMIARHYTEQQIEAEVRACLNFDKHK